jgi:hypothetical protein
MGFKEGDGTRVCARARVGDDQWTVRAIKGAVQRFAVCGQPVAGSRSRLSHGTVTEAE